MANGIFKKIPFLFVLSDKEDKMVATTVNSILQIEAVQVC